MTISLFKPILVAIFCYHNLLGTSLTLGLLFYKTNQKKLVKSNFHFGSRGGGGGGGGGKIAP